MGIQSNQSGALEKGAALQTAVETWKMLLARENLLHIPTCPKSNRGLTIHKDSKPRSELTSTYQPASALLGRGRPVDISFPQCACITFIKANKWRFKVKWRQQKVSSSHGFDTMFIHQWALCNFLLSASVCHEANDSCRNPRFVGTIKQVSAGLHQSIKSLQ